MGATSPNHYEDFELARGFDHGWGRTINAAEGIEFATTFLLHEAAHFDRPYARHLGHRDLPVSSLLVYSVALGLSVADLSEAGGAFLGSERAHFGAPVYPGDTLYASSIVVSRRASSSRHGFGIVGWSTRAVNQDGEQCVHLLRHGLVPYRSADRWRADVSPEGA